MTIYFQPNTVLINARDVAPDTLDDLCDELEEGEGVDAVIQKVSPYEAGWLAQHMHDRCSRERETFSERVQDEVKVDLPASWWRCSVLKVFRIFALRERSRAFASWLSRMREIFGSRRPQERN
jgi:hypothetical protein